MTHYHITVERFNEDHTAIVDRANIDCETPYTLVHDLAEWVQQEIDPLAVIRRHTLTKGQDQ